MGVSTDAIAFYGICFDEEDHVWPWQQDEDGELLDDPVRRRIGLPGIRRLDAEQDEHRQHCSPHACFHAARQAVDVDHLLPT